MQNIKKPYYIGETAFHHEGDVDFLIKLVKDLEDLNLNAIKFHVTVDLDSYMVKEHKALDVLRPWCFNVEQWDQILSEVNKCDIVLLCNDVKSVAYANACKFDVKAIEIHATGLNDVFLLDAACKFNGTVIIGTGGASLDEIDYAIQYLKSGGQEDIFLMHGFQNYPTDYKDIKLERMRKLEELFQCPIGYADHTDPQNEHNEYISCLALAKGYPVIEKHVTNQFGVKRVDSQAAISLDQMKKVMALGQIVFETNGKENALQLSAAELKYGDTGPMKKAIVACSDIRKGDVITLKNIGFKRTNESSSIRQIELNKLLNNTANKDIAKDQIIDLSNVDFKFSPQDISQFNVKSK